MADRLAGLAEVQALYSVDSRDETVVGGTAVDIDDLQGNLLVVLDAEAGTGTSPTLDLAIQHREDSDDDWANVPAAALYDPDTGDADTFDQVTDAAASTQQLALKRERLKAQLRAVLTIGGTTPDFVCAVYLVGMPKYSSGW
jgi:hypothetical protein